MEEALMQTLDIQELDSLYQLVKSKIEELNTLYYDLQNMLQKVNRYTICELKKCTDFYSIRCFIDETQFMHRVDHDLWDYVLTSTKIKKYITHDTEQSIRNTIEKEKTPFSKEAADKLTYNIMKNSGGIMGFTVKEVFDKLINATFRSKSTKKQNQHKIEKSFRMSIDIIADDYFGKWSTRNYGDRWKLLNDLETACRILDGKTRLEYPETICCKIVGVEYRKQTVFENDYFTVTLYKNGNCKIDFKSDIYEKINQYGSRGDKLSLFTK